MGKSTLAHGSPIAVRERKEYCLDVSHGFFEWLITIGLTIDVSASHILIALAVVLITIMNVSIIQIRNK